jgi:hypothetical protein
MSSTNLVSIARLRPTPGSGPHCAVVRDARSDDHQVSTKPVLARRHRDGAENLDLPRPAGADPKHPEFDFTALSDEQPFVIKGIEYCN